MSCYRTYFLRLPFLRSHPLKLRVVASSVVTGEASAAQEGTDDAEFQQLQKSSREWWSLWTLYDSEVLGSPIETLVDPGYSASITSFQKINPKAGIRTEDLRPANMIFRNYSYNQIMIRGQVELEFAWQLFLHSDQEEEESLLLGTNVVIPLGLIMQPATGVEAQHSQEKSGGVGTILITSNPVTTPCHPHPASPPSPPFHFHDCPRFNHHFPRLLSALAFTSTPYPLVVVISHFLY